MILEAKVAEKETHYNNILGDRTSEMKRESKESTFWLTKSIDRAHQTLTPPCISPVPTRKKVP